ncbi:hypothetical protein DFA_09220 [Cavenderia fasciculata]|uniref:Uncharacterized protein n=1 Tax=Cavenderia fasciculata TaxID=261658 RepID=F4Q710_CACFS|nr:uncharacterized protein DFA_09220 [Cavenderia fasciculata]EGG16192.1 hypothetical protein DFA_09220 [Cavenderia fasciculata]|eukprot:XP_004354576.1 hypothetical protein DFA_09220 [Cavenderia fasciculata]
MINGTAGFSLPSTIIINNDNSPPNDNPPHLYYHIVSKRYEFDIYIRRLNNGDKTEIISMSIGNCEKVPPANFFPSSLKSLKLIFSSEKSFIAGLLPLGLETLELNNYNGPVTLEYIPDTVTTLTINNIGHPMNTVLPSGLPNLTFRPESESPTMYPSTIRSINYQKRYQHTPTLFILPTYIESFSCDAVEAKTTYQNTVFSLPQIMIINNDDSPLADNPFHFVLPSRVAHLTAGVQVDNYSKFSFRLDTIINYSNVQDLSIIINILNLSISRFEEWMDFSFTHASAALETPLETNCRSYRTPKSCEEHFEDNECL